MSTDSNKIASVEEVSRRSLLRGTFAGAAVTATSMALLACGGNSSSASPNNGMTLQIAQQIAYDEQQHVLFLRTALGANAVAKPAINLSAMTGTLTNFLQLARAFEDVGVSAYSGAAPSLAALDPTANKAYLGAAARILATEALHSGNVRLQVAERNIQTTAVDSMDVLPPPTGSQYFTVDNQALAIARTPQQVAAIVGPFFPNGINGTFPPASAIDILNFALNLEYLEAEFYTWATTGAGIDTAGIGITGTGTSGATTGAKKVAFS